MKRLLLLGLALAAAGAVVYAFLSLGGEERPPALSGGSAAPAAAERRRREPLPEAPMAERIDVPAYPWRPPAWKREMRETLAGARVRVRLVERPLREVVAEVGRLLPYPVILDAGVPRTDRLLTVRMNDLDGLTAVRVLEHESGLRHYLRPGGIRLATPDGLPAPEGAEAVLAAIGRAKEILRAGGAVHPPLDKLLPIRIVDDSVWRAAKKVEARLRVPVVVDAVLDEELKAARVTVSSDELTARQVLDRVAGAARLGWAVSGRRILIAERSRTEELRREDARAAELAKREVEVIWKDRPLFRVAGEIEELAGIPVRVEESLWGPEHPRVTLRPGPQPLERLLRMLDAQIEASHLLTGEAIYLVRP